MQQRRQLRLHSRTAAAAAVLSSPADTDAAQPKRHGPEPRGLSQLQNSPLPLLPPRHLSQRLQLRLHSRGTTTPTTAVHPAAIHAILTGCSAVLIDRHAPSTSMPSARPRRARVSSRPVRVERYEHYWREGQAYLRQNQGVSVLARGTVPEGGGLWVYPRVAHGCLLLGFFLARGSGEKANERKPMLGCQCLLDGKKARPTP